jgi:2,3-bisphosphoglycerate-independent phosphoglycerate mutase
MIPSPKVPTYDKMPEMSVQAVADKVAEVVKSDEFEFVMCNFARMSSSSLLPYSIRASADLLCFGTAPDMVGHTGVYDAAVQAITATDKAVKTVYDACEAAGYVLMVTSDHGNGSFFSLLPLSTLIWFADDASFLIDCLPAEQMLNAETGNPHTAHTTNPVPFIMTGKESKGLGFITEDGQACLADVAPTVLDVLVRPGFFSLGLVE